jgi:hypothetical protein
LEGVDQFRHLARLSGGIVESVKQKSTIAAAELNDGSREAGRRCKGHNRQNRGFVPRD